MKKARQILIALILVSCLSGCKLFKKNCHCPSFGKANTNELAPKKPY
jgi:hypothetical protein